MRYSRQEILLGKKNQVILNNKIVAIVGVGAIGSVSAELLARAGINLILIDRDVIELNNLQRQLLYDEEDLDLPKAKVAKDKLSKINSEIKIKSFCDDLNFENINILNSSDLVLDCTDNLETRFLINDYCKKNNKTWIYSAGIKTQGTLMNILPDGPCFKCIFSPIKGLETCETVGILNSTTSLVGSLQVANAIKILVSKDVSSEMIRFDVWNNEFEKIKVHKNKNCSVCNGTYKYLSGKLGSSTIKLCGKNIYQIKHKIEFLEIKKKIENNFKVKGNDSFIHFENISLFKDGRALIKAKNEKEAKSIYSKFIGN